VFLLCWLQFAISGLRSFLESTLGWIVREGWTEILVFARLTRALHQLLLRHHACLQPGDRGITPGILFPGAQVGEEKDQTANDKHGDSDQAANQKRSPLFVTAVTTCWVAFLFS
jgi:hypothetical protein